MSELIRGLAEPLPAGERVLWQGAPRWQPLFVHAFHGRKLAFYFGAILLLRGAFAAADGASLAQAAVSALWLAPLALAALGLVALIAVLTARTTIYAITDRRVVMRIGIVLAITINIPFRIVESAGCRRYADGSGDLPLALRAGDRLAWLHLWPHVRPWRVAHPQPMLRAVDDAEGVASVLSRALAESAGGTGRAAPEAVAGTIPDRGPLVPATH
ncbi:MAG: photosynthetic complex putative assembly protein PuhB [Burkholderiales bacterium]